MSFTNHAENLALTWLLTTGSATRPTTWFVGLFTAAPGETGGGTEVSGGSYVRMAATFTVSGTAPTQATNGSAIEWAAATASWGTVTHAAIFDASSGGNMLAYATLTDPADFTTPLSKTVSAGDVFRINAGNLRVRLD